MVCSSFPETHPSAFADCYIYDLHISLYVHPWPTTPPPHPGICSDLFPEILRRLIGDHTVAALCVQSIGEEYFSEMATIEALLAPGGLRYVLLSGVSEPHGRAGIERGLGIGTLVVEWPADQTEAIVSKWFHSPTVELEGYIGNPTLLGRVADLYFQSDTEQRMRSLVRDADLVFRVWPDNNGLLLLSDKLDGEALQDRLRIAELNAMLAQAAERYQHASSDDRE